MPGDFNKPALTDTYTLFAQSVRELAADQAKGFDPALSLGTTNIPTNTIRWTSASNKWEKFNGTSWVNLASTYTINTSSADTLATARTISLTGDGTGTSASWNASTNASIPLTLATVNANVGTYGSSTNIPVLTVNAKGLITGISNQAIGNMAAQTNNAVSITGGSISATALTLVQSTTAAPTAEGRIEWDTDDDVLMVGNATGTSIFAPVAPVNQVTETKRTFSTGCIWNGTAVPLANGGTGATTAAAARTALGATAVGSAIFTAADVAAARTALGATAVGSAIFTAADVAAQRTALGATAVGTTIFTAADAAAQRTALGATAAGTAVFTAADAAAQRTILGATAAGTTIFTAADAAAQRVVMSAASLDANTFTGDQRIGGASALRGSYGGGAVTTNVALGDAALVSNTTGGSNTASGVNALSSNTTGYSNTASGANALYSNNLGYFNTAVGTYALNYNTAGHSNTAIGRDALSSNTTGNHNTASGRNALAYNTTGGTNTALGYHANTNSANYTNCAGIGHNAQPGGSNQMRLGDTNTVVYTQSGTVSASDLRDKADIRDTVLGLAFINSLRPVDYKWDIRVDYAPPPVEREDYETDEEFDTAQRERELATKPANLTHDGTRKRTRYHHGLIAQEVGALLANTNMDFGGYQDFEVKGGEAMQAIVYEELIAPMIKAIQELKAEFDAYKLAHP